MPCEPDAFVVAFLSQEQWGDRVLLAHRVFAICIVAVMSAWMLLLLEVTSVPAAYALAGASTAGCGAWLVFWVFVWVDPSAGLAQLREFAFRDLVQLQHLAIGALLGIAGLAELAFAAAVVAKTRATALRRPLSLLCSGNWLHSVWFCAMSATGVIFVTHPQQAAVEIGQHVAIGLGVLFGAYTLSLEKRDGVEHDRSVCEAPGIVLAAVCFGVAAVVLFTFKVEHAEPSARHVGVGTRCQSGSLVALVSFVLALALALVICAAAARDCTLWLAARSAHDGEGRPSGDRECAGASSRRAQTAALLPHRPAGAAAGAAESDRRAADSPTFPL